MVRVFISILALLLCFAGGVSADNSTSPVSRWRTIEKDGVHWLLDPQGRLFFSKGVNFIDSGKDCALSQCRKAFYWKNFYPSIDEWRRSVGEQLGELGFNTRGGWSDHSPEIGLALTVDLELGRNSKFHWFDPFRPDMEQEVNEWAEKLTAPYRNDPRLIGYYSDNEVGWWNSALFEWFLGKGWDNYTKRELWQMVYDHYEGNWEKFLQDWVPQGAFTGFEDLKPEGAKLKLRPGGRGIRLVDLFMQHCARHYYELMFRGIRRAHPEALVLGDRLPLYYHQDAILAIGDNVDVISTNYNIEVKDGWVAPYFFDGLRRLTDKPVLVTEFFFAAEENRTGNKNETARNPHPKPGHLMTVQTQAERASGVANAIRNFARFPNVLGAHWFQYCDEPMGGRDDGEDYNMGLIDTANCDYEEVSEVFRRFNPELDVIHQRSGVPSRKKDAELTVPTMSESVQSLDASYPREIPRASSSITLTDQSLADWDKEKTRLRDLKTPSPYVPFGDVHLAWTPEGLYLASISTTFVNPNFLAYEGEFPMTEAFQVHLLVEAEGRRNHFVIYLVPQNNPNLADGFEVKPRLFRLGDDGKAEPIAVEGRVQRIEKSLPHMLIEGFFPAEALGVKELRADMQLRMDVAMTNYYREFTMAWSDVPTLDGHFADPRVLKTVVLRDSENSYADGSVGGSIGCAVACRSSLFGDEWPVIGD